MDPLKEPFKGTLRESLRGARLVLVAEQRGEQDAVSRPPEADEGPWPETLNPENLNPENLNPKT